MITEQEFGRFNIYDVFSTFLPGSILIIGVTAPLTGLNTLFINLSVGGILLLIILSFGTGLGIQAIASSVSSASNGFSDHMDRVLPDEENGDGSGNTQQDSLIEISSIDYDFYQKCKYEYNLPADFSSWDRLFKLVLTDLEGRAQTRALRIQALYLGMRGMVITTILLFSYFLLILLLEHYNLIQLRLSFINIVILALVSLFSAFLAWSRQEEFRNDMIQYMIGDFCVIIDLPDDND